MKLQIRKLDEYEYDALHVELSISGNSFAAQQDSYIEDAEWLEFAMALQSFPKRLGDEVLFESGAPDGKYYCYILLRAFVYNGVGHTAIEVKMSNHSEPPYAASSHFYLLCEAATLNRLGRSLERWCRSKEKEFSFSTDAD